ncbi:MAG: lysozyme inhibitor LprI family protein [Ancalomicrobiaceae bacterium]|nr:lysozyme inhibitor LprI family protein [Ancalomicrobiaceae bacterium]
MAGQTKSIARIAVAAVLSLAAVATAHAQSFSCRTTNNCTEAVICSDQHLGRLDEKMADRYYKLRRLSDRRDARDLLESQRDWLADRNSCGCNADCLIDYYTSRIRRFDRMLEE